MTNPRFQPLQEAINTVQPCSGLICQGRSKGMAGFIESLIVRWFHLVGNILYLLFLVIILAVIILVSLGCGLVVLYACWVCLDHAFRIIANIIRVTASSLRCAVVSCKERWTIPPRRVGWRSLRGFPDSHTSLLSNGNCLESHICYTTGKLCQECFQIVEQSNLISGSLLRLFTPRQDWYKWSIALQGSELSPSRRACQLCNILWFSLDTKTRNGIILETARSRKVVFYWMTIWKESSSEGWFGENRYYLQLFHGHELPEKRRQLSRRFEIKEEQLNGQPTSVHIPSWTGSTNCIELAKSWITDCERNHNSYCRVDISEDWKRYLPHRLLYVGDEMSSVLHLQETSSADFKMTDIQYLTLSYCRGNSSTPASQVLTVDKQVKWQEHINEKGLPLTFQHAIHLTRQLGINYLWIDALCILQDSHEDWTSHSKNMGKVYANAHCTISACSSSDADGGCFHWRKDSPQYFPCYLRFSKRKALTIMTTEGAYDSNTFSNEVDESVSSQRAWILQERLLSRRIIHFSSRFLFFECNTHVASEVVKNGLGHRKPQSIWEQWTLGKRKNLQCHPTAFSSAYNPVSGYRAAFHHLRSTKPKVLSSAESFQLHRHWFQLVSKYTRAKITKPSDRSAGILGLVQAIQDQKCSLEYMNGLWKRHILFDLLWYIESGKRKKPEQHRAPSWSWLAVDGEVSQRPIPYEEVPVGKKGRVDLMKVAEVVSQDAVQSPHIPLEPLVEEPLMLKCPLLRVTDISQTQHQRFSLDIQGPDRSVKGIFFPDTSDFDQSRELFCAEIIREVIYNEAGKPGELSGIWSNGLVLNRTYYSTSQGVKVTYERVGRFRFELVEISGGNKRQVIRLV